MNVDRIVGNWKQLKGSVKQQWGRFTNDQFIAMEGRREKLAGKNQESYGHSMDEMTAAIKQHTIWEATRKGK